MEKKSVLSPPVSTDLYYTKHRVLIFIAKGHTSDKPIVVILRGLLVQPVVSYECYE